MSSQSGAAPPTQAPAEQRSVVVQASPSAQASVLFVCTQPSESSQLSVVHTLSSSQSGATPPAHDLLLHVSAVVQALASSQGRVLAALTQPCVGSQLSVVHRLLSSQSGATPPWQTPLEQVSLSVHALPSSHATVLFVWAHPDVGSQLSVVHTSLSLQLSAGPPVQMLSRQASAVVQASESSQGRTTGV